MSMGIKNIIASQIDSTPKKDNMDHRVKQMQETYINAFSVLKDSELSFLNEKMVSKQFKKDEVLIKEGTIADDIFFLHSGIVASTYTIKSKIFIRDFYFPPLMFTEQESFMKRKMCKFSIVSVTDIKCQVLSYKDLQTAFIKIPRLREVAYDMLLNGFINLSNRFENLLTLSPEERYVKLLNENSQLFQKIPLKMLASYLGITDVALSRIRKRISQK
jgi:CRP-like cAMP-binding protein